MNVTNPSTVRYADAFMSYLRFLEKDVWWTIVYVIFLAWMYLFHAPFRVHNVWRTDWYAQVTKVLQVWIGVVVFLFHTGSGFFQPQRSLQAEICNADDDTVATIFFPIFSTTTLIILYIHSKKRVWGLGVTYGSSTIVVVLNSLLLSLFSTVHFAYGMRIQDFEHSSLLKGAVGVLFPSPKQTLFPTLLLLSVINVLFITFDYQYKKRCGFDPLRGLLWSEVCRSRKAHEVVPTTIRDGCDWRKLQPKPKRISKVEQPWIVSPEGGKRLSFALSSLEIKQLSVQYPVNRPGMVPWFSTFIAGTALQSVLGNSLNFLTFDQRAVESQMNPKVFKLSFTKHRSKISKSYSLSRVSECSPSTSVDAVCCDPYGDDDYENVWFDFVADVGDGFNSTYEMARLMAQPFLRLASSDSVQTRSGLVNSVSVRDGGGRRGLMTPPLTAGDGAFLAVEGNGQQNRCGRTLSMCDYEPQENFSLPRASFVVVGGDLAYPNPTNETYRTRLLEPYNNALRCCAPLCKLVKKWYNRLVVPEEDNKDVARIHMLSASKVSEMTQRRDIADMCLGEDEVVHSTPLLFAIPGNHDWLDGLVTFKKFIIDESWMGGWFMPQKSSFFVINLPYNWFLLCVDTGSVTDIDPGQRNYFLNYIEEHLDVSSCVILISHEPGWIYEAMNTNLTSTMQPELHRVVDALGTRLRMRLCGDIHHYSRHTPTDALSEAPVLVVSGGGGAFLHGARNNTVIYQGTEYKREAAFPRDNHVTSFLTRLVGFRLINWKFDIIAGFMCFGLITSSLPLNMEDKKLEEIVDIHVLFCSTVTRTAELCLYTFDKGIISLFVAVCFFIGFFSVGSGRKSVCFRIAYSLCWTALVVFASSGMLAVVQTTMAYMMNHGLILSTKEQWSSMLESQVRTAADDTSNHLIEWLGDEHALSRGIESLRSAAHGSVLVGAACTLLRSMDMIENLAYLSYHVGTNVTGTLSHTTNRVQVVLYYLHILLIYWLLATPLLSFIIGVFLFVSVHYFDLTYDASYSSFQIEDYKHFLRFCLDGRTRCLHAYVVAEKFVPKVWICDGRHVTECRDERTKHLPPHLKKHPSRWVPHGVSGTDYTPTVLEHFVVRPHRVTQPDPLRE
ncbi:hypothetical protein, conserved [Trypanosoma brucei gambiense DAL972]|uniref:Calcineurin-like phosphoesterase domain-containing protein n=2 Tax=Trypanosoma brucei TaxID=5691 RepID=C9ZI58_TRYB9|nr:hypothetical protein, conserved [Trypanosoma brucei gambiense DAL972]RHW74196.1 Metallo-dependent phosphatase-like domain-containing protein [Trypanosoma brucei equiperdum]CBH08850.1 hypothetical protein, conserved [Trypanosoma brucei gambiense DAL972]|eukprot:XP_011771291.1 hypothetical protein, conserved [Trypanosoma brucei gambiense DAL972]